MKQNKNEKMKFYISILCALILVIISIIIRIPKEGLYYNNLDATEHTLLTMKCYDETPISVHKFLPIVSLGDSEDKNIKWGDTIPDKQGNYYYTSFSPVGFVIPYFFVKIFNLPINIYSLYALNSIICILSLVLLIIILCKLFSKYINKNCIILLTTLIYIFSIEVMHSQGVIFWVHSISQLLLLVHFLLFMNYKNKKAKIAFYLMCIIMPYVEWTGYISNVAFAIILFLKDVIYNKKITLKSFVKPIFIGIITILSFTLFSIHFLTNLNLHEYIHAIKTRFFARNITNSNVEIMDLLKGYDISYRYINILCSILLLSILSVKEYRNKLWKLVKEYKYEIIFFLFIILENFIMLEHAISYTFDRLKFIYILLIVFYIMISTISLVNLKDNKFIINTIIILLIIISILNVRKYKQVNTGIGYIQENATFLNDKIISTYINDRYNNYNSVMASNKKIRGYMNLLFNRGIYERKNFDDAKQISIDKNKRFFIYLNNITPNSIGYALILDREENIEYKIYTNNNELIIENI